MKVILYMKKISSTEDQTVIEYDDIDLSSLLAPSLSNVAYRFSISLQSLLLHSAVEKGHIHFVPTNSIERAEFILSDAEKKMMSDMTPKTKEKKDKKGGQNVPTVDEILSDQIVPDGIPDDFDGLVGDGETDHE